MGWQSLKIITIDNLQEIPDGSRESLSRKFTKQITEDESVRPIVSNEERNAYKMSGLHQRGSALQGFSEK